MSESARGTPAAKSIFGTGTVGRAALCKMIALKPFQKQFLRAATNPKFDIACLSLPRGNGKSFLAAYLLTRSMTPTDCLFKPGTESVLLSGSIEQCRIVFKFVRNALEDTHEYRFIDSATRCGITHKATNTRIRVHGSNSKTAFGLVNVPFVVWDEPGSSENVSGQLLHDAVVTSLGKPGSPLKAVFIGTVAPQKSGWWLDMVKSGSHHKTYVQALQGDLATWDTWPTIKKCNPLSTISKEFRAKLLLERDEARGDTRLKARFLSYRLNLPSADESTTLLTVDDWKLVLQREVPGREGKPIFGIDLGAGRAWSACVAVWGNGRVEAIACAPGVPDIISQEKRDRVPPGTYQKLLDDGNLVIAKNLRVQPPKQLIEMAVARFGRPRGIVCDFFRLNELRDCTRGIQVVPRRTRWSESSGDIRATRKMAKDGVLSVEQSSRNLLTASLASAQIENDTSGNYRLIKKATSNTSRDDVAAALVLACGQLERLPNISTGVYLGLVA